MSLSNNQILKKLDSLHANGAAMVRNPVASIESPVDDQRVTVSIDKTWDIFVKSVRIQETIGVGVDDNATLVVSGHQSVKQFQDIQIKINSVVRDFNVITWEYSSEDGEDITTITLGTQFNLFKAYALGSYTPKKDTPYVEIIREIQKRAGTDLVPFVGGGKLTKPVTLSNKTQMAEFIVSVGRENVMGRDKLYNFWVNSRGELHFEPKVTIDDTESYFITKDINKIVSIRARTTIKDVFDEIKKTGTLTNKKDTSDLSNVASIETSYQYSNRQAMKGKPLKGVIVKRKTIQVAATNKDSEQIKAYRQKVTSGTVELTGYFDAEVNKVMAIAATHETFDGSYVITAVAWDYQDGSFKTTLTIESEQPVQAPVFKFDVPEVVKAKKKAKGPLEQSGDMTQFYGDR